MNYKDYTIQELELLYKVLEQSNDYNLTPESGAKHELAGKVLQHIRDIDPATAERVRKAYQEG